MTFYDLRGLASLLMTSFLSVSEELEDKCVRTVLFVAAETPTADLYSHSLSVSLTAYAVQNWHLLL